MSVCPCVSPLSAFFHIFCPSLIVPCFSMSVFCVWFLFSSLILLVCCFLILNLIYTLIYLSFSINIPYYLSLWHLFYMSVYHSYSLVFSHPVFLPTYLSCFSCLSTYHSNPVFILCFPPSLPSLPQFLIWLLSLFLFNSHTRTHQFKHTFKFYLSVFFCFFLNYVYFCVSFNLLSLQLSVCLYYSSSPPPLGLIKGCCFVCYFVLEVCSIVIITFKYLK